MLRRDFYSSFSLTFSVIATLAAGCASVAVSDDAILANTAFTLAVDKSSVNISNREDDGVKTTYLATTTSGKRFNCYVTGTVSFVGRVVSDAMCSPIGKAAPSACSTRCSSSQRSSGTNDAWHSP